LHASKGDGFHGENQQRASFEARRKCGSHLRMTLRGSLPSPLQIALHYRHIAPANRF